MTDFAIGKTPGREPFNATRFIKEIGRGREGARNLSRADAAMLYAAMLERRVSDLELGAILLAMRIKGESVEEIAGFMSAAESSLTLLDAPAVGAMPILIPTYNGARKLANLTPLLSMLLAREGVPVLVHGVLHDAGRITTAEIFTALGWPLATSVDDIQQTLGSSRPVFASIDLIAPRMAGLLALRHILGVRSSTHTLVKILQPFRQRALRLCSYTHPEYLVTLAEYLTTEEAAQRGDALLMRGTEGEPVANTRRAQQVDWFHGGIRRTLIEKQAPVDVIPDMPAGRDAPTTAAWIQEVLDGQRPVPESIAAQVANCVRLARGSPVFEHQVELTRLGSTSEEELS